MCCNRCADAPANHLEALDLVAEATAVRTLLAVGGTKLAFD
jgi:hypothetical protein